jgi:Ni/Fe-hydrogenase 1 B-type cytochrome subunit
VRGHAPASSIGETARLVPYYVWELPVRVTHWLIVFSIFTLAFTGFYIGDPFLIVHGEARQRFVMGTMKAIHFYAAIVFTISVLVRIAWAFVGNHWARWYQFLPVHGERLRILWEMFLYYIFLRRHPPLVVGHNPVAGVAYMAIFGLYFVEILTGLALYSANAAWDSPLQVFGPLVPLFGGLQMARWIHHVVMWLLLGFFVHHLAAAILFSVAQRTGTLESIFSGLKFVPPEQIEKELPGARK